MQDIIFIGKIVSFFLKSLLGLFSLFLLSEISFASENCNIIQKDFTKGAVSMYGQPQPEKTLSLINTMQGGVLRFGQTLAFESVNPFIAASTAPFVLKDYLYDSMMYRSPAEPFTLYPQIVSVYDMDEARKFVTFKVEEGTKFDDGSDVTAKDIQFTFDLLKEKGRYNYRIAYKHVTAKILSDDKIRFNIHNNNRELPLLLGLMPVLSHKNNRDDFGNPLALAPIGAGAYKIKEKAIGKNITLIRNEDYYGRDRPISCLRFHFDRVKIDFFKNEQASFENFKAGESDFFYENALTRLNRAYSFPAFEKGDVQYHNLATGRPSGLYGFVFNTRRRPWDDLILRRVISDIFAFDTLNKHYLYDTEKQIDSVFMGSDLAYNAGHKKKKNHQIRRDILTSSFKKLKEAGYHIHKGNLISPDGKEVVLDILLSNPRHEKYALLLRWMLRDIGIKANVQSSDDALYQKRVRNYDYDMVIDHRYVSLSPGTEQRNFWGCAGRETEGTRNYAGICDENIEQALDRLDKARSYEALKLAVHQIDQMIMQGHYYIPLEAKQHYHIFTDKNIVPSSYGEKYFFRRK